METIYIKCPQLTNYLNFSYSSNKIFWLLTAKSLLIKEQYLATAKWTQSQAGTFMISVRTKNRNRNSKAPATQREQRDFVTADAFSPFVSFLWEQTRPSSHISFRGRAEKRLWGSAHVHAYKHVCAFPLAIRRSFKQPSYYFTPWKLIYCLEKS